MAGTRKLNQNGLTNKVQIIYDFIVEEQERVGYPPSVREICEYMGLKNVFLNYFVHKIGTRRTVPLISTTNRTYIRL